MLAQVHFEYRYGVSVAFSSLIPAAVPQDSTSELRQSLWYADHTGPGAVKISEIYMDYVVIYWEFYWLVD